MIDEDVGRLEELSRRPDLDAESLRAAIWQMVTSGFEESSIPGRSGIVTMYVR